MDRRTDKTQQEIRWLGEDWINSQSKQTRDSCSILLSSYFVRTDSYPYWAYPDRTPNVVIGHVLAGLLYSYWAYPVVDLSINVFTIPAPYKPVTAQTLLRTTLFRWSYPFKISLLGAFCLLTQLLPHITSDVLNAIWVITPSSAALLTLNQRRASIYDDLHLWTEMWNK
jgi:hypothetical protein